MQVKKTMNQHSKEGITMILMQKTQSVMVRRVLIVTMFVR